MCFGYRLQPPVKLPLSGPYRDPFEKGSKRGSCSRVTFSCVLVRLAILDKADPFGSLLKRVATGVALVGLRFSVFWFG